MLVLAVTWALGAVGWYLLARLWWRELFVPGAVFSTVLAVLIATLWAVFLWWWALLWSRYHYYRYFRRNKRQLAPPALRAQRLLWQESLLSPPCPSVSSLEVSRSDRDLQEVAVAVENAGERGPSPDEALLLGTVLWEDLRDEAGRVVVAAGEVITPEVLERVVAQGLYGELITKLAEQKAAEEKA